MVDRAVQELSPGSFVDVETTVAHVTFFEDRAEVVRIVRCSVPRGRSRIHARGITLLVDDRTVAVRTTSSITLVSTRIRRRAEEVVQGSAEEIASLEADCDRSRARLEKVDRELSTVTVERRRAAALIEQWARTVEGVPSRAEAAADELGRAYAALDADMTRSFDAESKLLVERGEAERELGRAEARLGQARARRPRYESFAEIELVAEEAAEVVIELVYRTPCALWRPEHRARLVRTERGHGEITVTTFATIWQRTGEIWRDIPCRFSTARPANAARAPELREDVLATRKKSEEARRRVVVEARDQTIATIGTAHETRDVAEMPGVEDGGEALWLTGLAPATIESDGRPVRVEITEGSFPCTVARVCFPELGPGAHLRATASWPGPIPLLAGPVTLGRETEIVGKATVKFVGPGESFDLGFGVDDGIRVRRKVVEKRKTTQLTGTQHVSRQVTLFVSNSSDDRRSVAVVERVPVSEVEDVKIDLERQTKEPMRFEPRDGFATFDLELSGRETREISLEYRIEAKPNVVLPAFDPPGV